MGRLDQYAKEIFAAETPAVTRGGAAFQPPAELNLTEVRLDGSLLIRVASRLLGLAAPWSLVGESDDEVTLEIKMQGDHLDMRATERGLLRRQARQVQRMENGEVAWDGDMPFWMVASHVPSVLRRRRTVREAAPGCYRVETGSFQFLWIAANELPLHDELVPFLIARTGRPLDEFGLWVEQHRPPGWLSRMVEFLPMSAAVHEELLRFALIKTDDPEIKARQKLVAKVYVEMTPEVKDEVTAEARAETRLADARSSLRRVLARRKLPLGPEEQARIDACMDVATLERWLDQAVDAPTAADALR